MHYTRLYYLLFALFISITDLLYAQTKNSLHTETTALTQEATRLMRAENYEKSLILSRNALSLAISLKDDNLIALSYNTIAANFDQLAEYEKALFYYKKGLIHANKTDNNHLKNWLNNNLGNIYCFDKKEYAKGIYYYKKSLEYSIKSADSSEIILTKLNITWAYFDINKFSLGFPYLNYVNKHHKKHGDETTIVALKMLNGMYYSHLNNAQKATFYFDQAIKLGEEGNEKSDLSFAYQEYSKFLFKTGHFKKAYEYLKAYNELTAKINNEDKLKKLNVAGINLEIDEYRREIDNIKTEYKTQHQILLEKQSKNKLYSITIISILLLIIVFSYLYFQNNKLKQKNKLKNIESKIQENIITASINGQEIERKKIAAFLHDNISALLSSAALHLSVFSTKNKNNSEEITKTKAILIQAHYKIRDLSHQLLPSLLARFGLFFALNDLCEMNSNSTIHFEYSSSVSNETRYNEDYEMRMYFIISELLNNIIKHSEANKAKLSLKEINSQLRIVVSDNGKGFEINQYQTIEGFGLNQIKARINTMNGKFKIISKPKEGTRIEITVPIEYAK
ncbi:Histidine kinase [Flavobacterium flevense]|uniref:histidine kinase n=1 Tax=Flavobacterium flevense TaxID=983 RepID=A0A4Y4B1B2_9FLAO|nr:tetratricopeptide repeat-containing sensor histidine kinase [Flavobacterium flevense]GEC73040.1 two-component sensor histidine kinase [Flavobacterium flevense]SHM03327.1 Histidine kinase [Flavobacterium flevense]